MTTIIITIAFSCFAILALAYAVTILASVRDLMREDE